ncbi:kinase, sugar kinase superfamily protein [Halogeometricum borinquense DSM 11551]|uniref:Pantoate kinase n=2 Tax=Halogeometricum borinquense (strain ATCC 700274 / DSM 11551 / JCM 10706 / KCTC 4070 / PR3) TaxID=469382 RepID=L9UR88_HALBP|nr:kinase, sugar kinase superfamily protein [Halogeometricum borinquense DSM 11551]
MATDDNSMTTAYAPGSVTTVFVPQSDPEEGSLGVSFAVEDGVHATVKPTDETVIRLDGTVTSFEPVAGVLDSIGVTADVSLEADIPVGCGFGASGAATLATALAAADVFDLELSREDVLTAAHRAEVAAGTGLGDVFVQEQGGLVWNTGDGRDRTERDDRIEYTSTGGIATQDVLRDEGAITKVADAGTEALSTFHPGDSLQAWFNASWAFAKRTELPTQSVEQTVERVLDNDGAATMAMVGETVLATGVEGVLDESTRITNDGAHVR